MLDKLIDLFEAREEFRHRRYQLMLGWVVFLLAAAVLPITMMRLFKVFGLIFALALLALVLMTLVIHTVKNEMYGRELNTEITKKKREYDTVRVAKEEGYSIGNDGELIELQHEKQSFGRT